MTPSLEQHQREVADETRWTLTRVMGDVPLQLAESHVKVTLQRVGFPEQVRVVTRGQLDANFDRSGERAGPGEHAQLLLWFKERPPVPREPKIAAVAA